MLERAIVKVLIEPPSLDLSQYFIKLLAFDGPVHETLASAEACEFPRPVLKF